MTTLPTFYVVMYESDDGVLVWDDPWDAYGTAEDAQHAAAKVRHDNPGPAGPNVLPRAIAVYRCTPGVEK